MLYNLVRRELTWKEGTALGLLTLMWNVALNWKQIQW